MNTTPMDSNDLEGKTRAELLELCRAVGLKATAWKRDRMLAVLTGSEASEAPASTVGKSPAKKPRQGAERESNPAADVRKKLELRTGRCVSQNGCNCDAYEAGPKDAFGWQLCVCGHTNWSHQTVNPGTEEQAADGASEA